MNTTPYPMSTVPFAQELITTAVRKSIVLFFLVFSTSHKDTGQNAMVANGKGLLAADESTGTIGTRFEKIGVANTLENRVAYREALFSAPTEISEYIGGVILFEETLESKGSDGRLLVDLLKDRKIILGIKTDKGTKVSGDGAWCGGVVGGTMLNLCFCPPRSWQERMERR